MAQGKFKAPKQHVPGKKKDKKASKQKFGLKKGSLNIAPKKKRLQEAASVKKGLEKGIRVCIEEELTQKTRSLEPKALAMLKTTASTSKK
ncbi:UPF0390 protein zgc136864 [Aplysia californica]|uniref:UPF0390 protein zgc136864 n=1 Tax=Aplysia californica TaxID=6500 RepID=A0ABM0JVF8_APLCA|nr:UPF0390 protein zgc136864 [Aplysia californica]